MTLGVYKFEIKQLSLQLDPADEPINCVASCIARPDNVDFQEVWMKIWHETDEHCEERRRVAAVSGQTLIVDLPLDEDLISELIDAADKIKSGQVHAELKLLVESDSSVFDQFSTIETL
ncbi:hypothetical protein [Allohahella marinimesophila]|uniref:Uncharacterized protein n=1 Tax=Allohahella marinimesophila TaxID=1054972 RepID=A0ABP7Q8P0_9GAMM